jgi:urea transporter
MSFNSSIIDLYISIDEALYFTYKVAYVMKSSLKAALRGICKTYMVPFWTDALGLTTWFVESVELDWRSWIDKDIGVQPIWNHGLGETGILAWRNNIKLDYSKS